jgi:hypothetical protein
MNYKSIMKLLQLIVVQDELHVVKRPIKVSQLTRLQEELLNHLVKITLLTDLQEGLEKHNVKTLLLRAVEELEKHKVKTLLLIDVQGLVIHHVKIYQLTVLKETLVSKITKFGSNFLKKGKIIIKPHNITEIQTFGIRKVNNVYSGNEA